MSTCMKILLTCNLLINLDTLFKIVLFAGTYANDIVPHTCKMQYTYVGMRLHSVNMRLIYVDVQVNYVKMQDMYVQMQEHYVNMRPNDISIRYNFNMFKGSILG